MMHETDERSTAIRERLERLERSNRRFRAGVFGSLVLVGGLVIAGMASGTRAGSNNSMTQPTRKEVSTERLIIVGSDSKPRVMIQGSESGASLFLYGPDEYKKVGGGGGGGEGAGAATGISAGFVTLTPRMRFQVTEEYSRIQMLDPDGKERILLRLDAEEATIKVFDEEGNEVTD